MFKNIYVVLNGGGGRGGMIREENFLLGPFERCFSLISEGLQGFFEVIGVVQRKTMGCRKCHVVLEIKIKSLKIKK